VPAACAACQPGSADSLDQQHGAWRQEPDLDTPASPTRVGDRHVELRSGQNDESAGLLVLFANVLIHCILKEINLVGLVLSNAPDPVADPVSQPIVHGRGPCGFVHENVQ